MTSYPMHHLYEWFLVFSKETTVYETFKFFTFLNFVDIFFKYTCKFDFIYGLYKCKVHMTINTKCKYIEVTLIDLDTPPTPGSDT